MNARRMLFGILGLAVGLTLGFLTGFVVKGGDKTVDNTDPSFQTSSPAEEETPVVILSYGLRGGLCTQGPCHSTYSLYATGELQTGGQVSDDELARLIENVGFLDLEASQYPRRFEKDCGGSLYDDADRYIRLPRTGTEIENCSPLSTEGERAYDEIWATLGEPEALHEH